MSSIAKETNPPAPVGEGISTGILLIVMLFSLTTSINVANWADGLGILNWSTMGGIVLGILLAKLRRIPGTIVHPFMLILGIPATLFFGSTLMPVSLPFEEKWMIVLDRIQFWFNKVMVGGSSTDALVFVLQLAFLIWVISYLAAWFVYRRHQVWGAIFPTGIALLINIFYAVPQTHLYLILFLVSALLLLARMNLHSMERWWRQASIGYTSDISFDFILYGVVFSLVAILIVWMLPATPPGPTWFSALDPFLEPWTQFQDQFNRAFGSLRAAARPAPASFGTMLTMGGPINLGQKPIMDIQTSTGRYWRATVYDQYTGVGWINTHLNAVNVPANDTRLDVDTGYQRIDVTQTVKVYISNQNVLFAQSQPIQFDLPSEVFFGRPASADAMMFDFSTAHARRPLRSGDTYTVVSAISAADEDALRNDSMRYSDWITSTYLQLPPELPGRVRNLAKEVTAPYGNPYDKASAIEQYLRKKIKYNEQVSAPPTGRDGVDYTLFDRSEGYCNYYASAMAVMLRAVGIPARVASGYTLGQYENGVYHIVEANAHSWTEVYFPNYGWIEFEPTANKPEIDRPKNIQAPPSNPDLSLAAEEERRRREFERFLEEDQANNSGRLSPFSIPFLSDPAAIGLTLSVLAALLVIGTLWFVRRKQLQQMAHLTPAAHIYETMLARARWLGVREQKYETPLERAAVIGIALPTGKLEAEQIALSYTRERFGARQLGDEEKAQLESHWSHWRDQWRQGFIALVIERIVTPLRNFIADVRRAIERWGRG